MGSNFNKINNKLIFHRHFLNSSKINLPFLSFLGKYSIIRVTPFLSVHKSDIKIWRPGGKPASCDQSSPCKLLLVQEPWHESILHNKNAFIKKEYSLLVSKFFLMTEGLWVEKKGKSFINIAK